MPGVPLQNDWDDTVEGLLNYTESARLPAVDSSAFRKAPREETQDQAGFGF